MSKTVVLTGKAVVNFRKVIEDVPDHEVEDLLASDDLRGANIEEDDLLGIEWIHDDVDMKVSP